MDDTDKPDPTLAQLPLIQNPEYQPPKAITLSHNYERLLPSMRKTSVPPSMNLSQNDLDSWLAELEDLRDKLAGAIDADEVKRTNEWLRDQQRKVAPGFEGLDGIMRPKARASETEQN